MQHNINGNLVEVTMRPGLEVIDHLRGPGAYDFLTYRGFEIATQEQDDGGLYNGRFYVFSQEVDNKDFATLNEALDWIEAQ